MPKFFVDPAALREGSVLLDGDNAAHIAKTLRMRPGELLTVCDGEANDYICRILSSSPSLVEAEILSSERCPAEPETEVTLYMALPKSDKLELVVQKAVELGAARICVYRSSRCIPDPDTRAFEKRLQRLHRIAAEAAGQSYRGRIPEVTGLLSFSAMLKNAAASDMPLFFYEHGGTALKTLLGEKPFRTAAAVVGPEGGFSEEEAEAAKAAGLFTAHLGPRILRCETAAIGTVTMILYHTDSY